MFPEYALPSFFGSNLPLSNFVFTSKYLVEAFINPSCNAGKTSAIGFIEEPVCLGLCVALFSPLAVVFSPSPPTTPTTYPVSLSITTIAA